MLQTSFVSDAGAIACINMKRKLFFVLVFTVRIILHVHAQCFMTLPMAPSITNTAAISDSFNALSFIGNPSNLPEMVPVSLALHCQKPYMLESTNSLTAAIHLKVGNMKCGMAYRQIIYEQYRETNAVIALSKPLHDRLNLGLQLGFGTQTLPQKKSSWKPLANVGMLIKPSRIVHFGVAISSYFDPDEKWRTNTMDLSFMAGIGALVTNQFQLSLDVTSIPDVQNNVVLGLSYDLHKMLRIRNHLNLISGVNTTTVDLILKRVQIQIISSIHPQLGFTPSMSLLFHSNKKS